MLKKKIWANFQRIVEVFTQKIFNMFSNIWVWDPGSGKNLFRIPDLGVKKAPDPGSGSATLIFLTLIPCVQEGDAAVCVPGLGLPAVQHVLHHPRLCLPGYVHVPPPSPPTAHHRKGTSKDSDFPYVQIRFSR
jgi:hypothetical protein